LIAAAYNSGICHRSVTTKAGPYLELQNVLHVDTLVKIVSKDSGRTSEMRIHVVGGHPLSQSTASTRTQISISDTDLIYFFWEGTRHEPRLLPQQGSQLERVEGELLLKRCVPSLEKTKMIRKIRTD
jgi:hypothetical protein